MQDREDIAGIDSDMSLAPLAGILVLPGMLHTIRDVGVEKLQRTKVAKTKLR